MCVKEADAQWLRRDMALRDFDRISPWLRSVKSVVLEGWGESLMHPRLIDFVRSVKAQGPEVGFVTSGYGLSEERSRALIDGGIDFIGFSLAGCTAQTHNRIRVRSDFDRLQESIRAFVGIVRSRRSRGPKVHIVYLALKENMAELPQVVDVAYGLGIGEVIVITNAHVATAWQDEQRVFSCGDVNPYGEVMAEAAGRARRLRVRLTLPALAPTDVAVCSENPLENVYVSVQGEVSPCVYLQPPVHSPFSRIFCGHTFPEEKVSFGNLFREEWDAIWGRPEYVAFRRSFEERGRCRRDTIDALMELKVSGVRPLPAPPESCRRCHKVLGF